MIPHKNLFFGALGKLENIGGSRAYTTPHTVSVPAEHIINVTQNIQGDLIGHSLDGRLWLYRRSRRLGIIALKWNSTKGELEYAAVQNISNNDDVVLACGMDWVLTNNNIFMVSDEEPYIRSARLFDANIPDTYLYSILRSGSIGTSGIDSFTGEAWGKRDDNGNSEGTGYFSKSTHLLYPAGFHSFEQCYSLLPAVGDWQIFENFLVRRPDAESITSYNYMQAVRPLIPLEFNKGLAVYGTGYNFDHRGIQLFNRKGEIFGKGFKNIGKVSLLPAVFGEDGNVQEYYLYISPDFILYPYSDFFYCHISTFDVNPDKEQNNEESVGEEHTGEEPTDYEPVIHSFAVSSIARTWAEAKAACETMGGHLATSTSAEKNAFLVSLIGGNTVWLGGTDEEKEDSWRWVTGEEWSYINWNSNEPNDSGGEDNGIGEDYLELQSSGMWNDANAAATRFYICEWDYELKENDFIGCLWPNIAIASIGTKSLYGVVSEQSDAVTPIACIKSTDGRVLIPQTGEFLTLSENNAHIFFDVFTHKGLLLDDDGGQLMLGETISDTQDVSCKTLNQWLAPAGKVDAVTDDYIVASADNSAFCTSLITGFNRQFLSPNAIPLTAKSFQDSKEDYYRLAVSESVNENNRKIFGVNKILSQNITQEAILWQNIYKEPVNFSFVKIIDRPDNFNYCWALEYDYNDTSGEDNVVIRGGSISIPDLYIYGQKITRYAARTRTDEHEDDQNIYYDTYIDTSQSITTSDSGAYYYKYYVGFSDTSSTTVQKYVILSASAKVIFLNPLDGSLQEVSFSRSFQQIFSTTTKKLGSGTIHYYDISRAEVPQGIGYIENKIGFFGFIYNEESGSPSVFFPCADLPDFVHNIWGHEDIQPSITMPINNSIIGWDNKQKPCNVRFYEQSSGVNFIQQSSIHQDSDLDGYSLLLSYTNPNNHTKFVDSSGINRSKQNFHIIETYSNDKIKLLLFHSEVSPEIFDFYTEIERSKPQ